MIDRNAKTIGPCWTFVLPTIGWIVATATTVEAAELSVSPLRLRPQGAGRVVVSGAIDAESTFGVSILLELVARPGSRGTVAFTPAGNELPAQRPTFTVRRGSVGGDEIRVHRLANVGVDIVQVGDAWPSRGTFSAFDTDRTETGTLNGAVDDNGTFIASPVSYSGPLAVFGVKASANAVGVWDVTLSTHRGESGWEGLATTLVGGSITVTRDACAKDRECGDRDPCTADRCQAGTCVHVRRSGPCSDATPPVEHRKNRKRKSDAGHRR